MERNRRSIIGHIEEMKDAGFREMANRLVTKIKRHTWGWYHCDYSSPPLKLRGHQVEKFRELDKY